MRWLLICLAIAGCARAGRENSIIGGLTDARPSGDADTVPAPDASPIDAPPQQVTLTQTASNGITRNNSFGCVDSGITHSNSYYRVFKLADHAITTTLHVTQVVFGIEAAAAGGVAVSQPATLRLGTYSGTPGGTTLDLSLVRMVNSMDIQIPDGSATRMAVPITGDIAPTTSVIVELAIPDGTADGNEFFVGTNTDVERAPGYTLGPDCGVTSPTSMQSIADDPANMFGNVHLVMTVTGMTDLPN
ncbi:MAG TPA: hypothetical protein VHT91_22525 [Kofleriaceae bacterium]|jgi:hypothetical protein|nr:hypothetical protein [Kofleriaceae bacterium]